MAPSQGVQTAELPATYTPVPASEPVGTYEMPTEGLEIELPSGIESLPVRLPSGQVHGHKTIDGVERGYGWAYIESLELPWIHDPEDIGHVIEHPSAIRQDREYTIIIIGDNPAPVSGRPFPG